MANTEDTAETQRARRKPRALFGFVTASLLAFGVACGTAENIETNGSATTSRNAEVAHNSSQRQTATGVADGGATQASTAAPRVPGGTPVDTSGFDADIKRLEATLRKRTDDPRARQELAVAYAARAARLTEVQQYRSALGDWRRTAKLDPANAQAQNMIATITNIMQSMNREVPAPGTEPTPLPFKQ